MSAGSAPKATVILSTLMSVGFRVRRRRYADASAANATRRLMIGASAPATPPSPCTSPDAVAEVEAQPDAVVERAERAGVELSWLCRVVIRRNVQMPCA